MTDALAQAVAVSFARPLAERRGAVLAGQIALLVGIFAAREGIVAAVLIAWEGTVLLQYADRFFFGQPSEVVS